MNLVDARVEGGVVHFGPYSIPLPADRRLDEYTDRRLVLGIRPHDFEDADVWKSDLPTLEVKADVTEELGSEVHVIFTVDAPPVVTEHTVAANEPDEGEFVPLVEAEGKTSFTARVDPRTTCGPGSMVRLTVDPGRFHFFERDSGKAIGAPSALATSAP